MIAVQEKTDEGTAMSPELHDRKPRVDSVDEILFLWLLCGLLGQAWLIYDKPRPDLEHTVVREMPPTPIIVLAITRLGIDG
jgi:hypothetical protein